MPFAALAKREGVSPSYFTRLVRLSYLAPDITQAILDGSQPRDLTADKLLAHSRLPLAWHEQPTVLGFYLNRPEPAQSAYRAQPWPLPDPPHSAIAVLDAAVLEFGPTEILPPGGAI